MTTKSTPRTARPATIRYGAFFGGDRTPILSDTDEARLTRTAQIMAASSGRPISIRPLRRLGA